MVAAYMRLPSGVRLAVAAVMALILTASACEASPGAGGWN